MQLFRDWFGPDWGIFSEISFCESRYKADAFRGSDEAAAAYVNAFTIPEGPGLLYVGLLQMDAYCHQGLAAECAFVTGREPDLFDPVINVCAASFLTITQGLSPWKACLP